MKPAGTFLTVWIAVLGVTLFPGAAFGATLTSTNPAADATNVIITTDIIAYFDTTSVSVNDFYVTTGSGYDLETVNGSWAQSGSQFTFSPSSPLTHTATYTAHISYNSGYGLADHSWSFTTQASSSTAGWPLWRAIGGTFPKFAREIGSMECW